MWCQSRVSQSKRDVEVGDIDEGRRRVRAGGGEWRGEQKACLGGERREGQGSPSYHPSNILLLFDNPLYKVAAPVKTQTDETEWDSLAGGERVIIIGMKVTTSYTI
jgi:hypothetical protein